MPRLAVAVLLLGSLATPASGSEACASDLHRLVERLVGTWREFTVTDDGELFIGTLTTSTALGGCAFRQRFELPDGEELFESFGYVDGDNGEWRETFVFTSGRVVLYRWRTEGDDIVMEPEEDASPEGLRRLRITNLGADAYDVLEQRSDDGVSWRTVELTRTRRMP